MPLHRYECESCGHRFRILHLEGTEDQADCPSCGGKDTRRLLARVSIQFKGSGYYKTDRANKRNKAGTKSLESKDENGSSSEKTSDAKPDAKPSDDD